MVRFDGSEQSIIRQAFLRKIDEARSHSRRQNLDPLKQDCKPGSRGAGS